MRLFSLFVCPYGSQFVHTLTFCPFPGHEIRPYFLSSFPLLRNIRFSRLVADIVTDV